MSTSKSIAKVHTHQSNRVKRRNPTDPNRKVVFKSVLDTPFRIPWPSIPENVQNGLLASTVALLDGVAEYHLNRPSQSRKRKREETAKKGERDGDGDEPMSAAADDTPRTIPSIMSHMTIGINQVTKALETQIKLASTNTQASSPSISLVLVCRPDVDPPILIDHIPHLIAAFNSISPPSPLPSVEGQAPQTVEGQEGSKPLVRLATLPKGSERILAQALGLRRVAVLAFHETNPDVLSKFTSSLQTLPILSAPWLSTPPTGSTLIPTHVKQMKTTTPKDMKGAKEERVKGRLAAKQKQDLEKKKSVDALKAGNADAPKTGKAGASKAGNADAPRAAKRKRP